MNPFLWLAWRLPGNVTVIRTYRGHEKRNLNRTLWGWIKWRLT